MGLESDLIAYLVRAGPSGSTTLQQQLGISQPTFSRLVRAAADELLVAGRARNTRYAARRSIPDVAAPVPLYAIGEDAKVTHVASLHAVHPNGFWVEPNDGDSAAQFHHGLPYFLADLRPAGFLGRMIPRRHPELGAPVDINQWSDVDCIRYFSQIGWNLPGNLVVGDPALEQYLEHVRKAPPGITTRQRSKTYPHIVEDILAYGPTGSSAAGEQPKFLATRGPKGIEVLVKFSPPVGSPVGRRWGDLLAAEHIAHSVLSKHGFPAPRSQYLEAGGRAFLEVERFDRTPGHGRRGVLSCMALDLEYVGSDLASWSKTATELARQKRIDQATAIRVSELELFGALIANTDMHAGNLSFLVHGEQVIELTPAYDMVPMLFAPQHNEIPLGTFVPPTPRPTDAAIWKRAGHAALELWETVASDDRVSRKFRGIAAQCATAVRAIEAVAELLPG